MSSDQASTTATSPPPCSRCNEPGIQRCAGCKSTRYCSSDCQKKDWDIHKMLCKTANGLQDRPGPNFRRAVYFSVDEPAPRFVWIPYVDSVWTMDNDYIRRRYFNGVRLFRYKSFEYDEYLKRTRKAGYSVYLWHDEDFLGNGQPQNSALNSVAKVDMSRRWRGPLLAVPVKVNDYGTITKVLDAGPETLSIVAEMIHLESDAFAATLRALGL